MVGLMLTLSSTSELLSASARARATSRLPRTRSPPDACSTVWLLRRSAGARVRVRLEGYIYKDDGSVTAANAAAIAQLRAAGADAQLVHPQQNASDAMLHCKAALVDGDALSR